MNILYIDSSSALSFRFFSFILLRPLSSTLFPYTTLFRSYRPAELLSVERPSGDPLVAAVSRLSGGRRPCPERALQDRKSTRLNSSHRCISYAVFCLKKKKPLARYGCLGQADVRSRAHPSV